jgi:hypothetical protein
MVVDSRRYNVPFRAPAIPYAPKEYNPQDFDEIHKVLRIYFNQLDNGLEERHGSPSTIELASRKGADCGCFYIKRLWFNTAVGTTLIAPWELAASTQYVYPSSAEVMALVSSSAY